MALEKTFDAAQAENRLYEAWETSGSFTAGANASRPETFCIMIPPPNVTGALHVGHAFNNTLQDVFHTPPPLCSAGFPFWPCIARTQVNPCY